MCHIDTAHFHVCENVDRGVSSFILIICFRQNTYKTYSFKLKKPFSIAKGCHIFKSTHTHAPTHHVLVNPEGLTFQNLMCHKKMGNKIQPLGFLKNRCSHHSLLLYQNVCHTNLWVWETTIQKPILYSDNHPKTHSLHWEATKNGILRV